MLNCDQQHLELLADKMIIDIKQNPFSYKTNGILENYSEEDIKLLESILMTKMPNLVIRHIDKDTSDDLSEQLKKLKNILLNNELPCFIDFSIMQHKVKTITKDN